MPLLRHVIIPPKVLFFLRLGVGGVIRREGTVEGGEAAAAVMPGDGAGDLPEGGAGGKGLWGRVGREGERSERMVGGRRRNRWERGISCLNLQDGS